MNGYKKFRCKSKTGYSCMWQIGPKEEGKFGITSLGDVKFNGDKCPLSFLPFELTNAVVNGPRFNSMQKVEDFVRNL